MFYEKIKSREEQEKAPAKVAWIDRREIPDLVETQAGALHFLRSVLGSSHDASPWVEEEEETADTRDDIVVLALEEPYAALLDFRVSDAAPSWFCHSIVSLENLEEEGSWWNHQRPSADAPPATLVVYKILFPRRIQQTRNYRPRLDVCGKPTMKS
jgi:hypothetical protein